MVASIQDQAGEALLLAEANPRRSVELATEAGARARREHDPAAGAVAARALGLAALHLEDHAAAEAHLRGSIELGRRAGSATLVGEAQMSLAFVLNSGGRPGQALRTIGSALAVLRGVQRARARAQRAAILQDLGRLEEALADYHTALPALRRADDRLWIQRVLLNRAVLRARRLELSQATADLREAERLCRELGRDLVIGYIHQNLSFVERQRGNVPVALHWLDQAERRLRAHGAQLGILLADRAELLLSAYLVAEARDTAGEAARELAREGRDIVLADTRLLLARATRLDGDPAEAARQAEQARVEFARQHRHEWAAMAWLTARSAGFAEHGQAGISMRRLAQAVRTLAGSWPDAALEGRLLAARVALARGRRASALTELRRASRARHHGPATLRARGWYAEALARLTERNERAAMSAVRAGLRILEDYTAALGATDLRAHAAGHRTELAELGLQLSLRGARPEQVFGWAEVGRAAHLMQSPARPPDDRALADTLAELRGAVLDVDEARRSGHSAASLLQRQIALEHNIRDRHRRDGLGSTAQRATVLRPGAIAKVLGDAALIQYIRTADTLHAVTIAGGRTRLRHLGPATEVADLLDRIMFALHRLARPRTTGASRAAATALLEHSAATLDGLLLEPLPEVADRPLIVVPTGPLQSMPWSILPSVVGRPVTVCPSAALWHTVHRRPGAAHGPVLVAAGPGLPGALEEARAVAALYATEALVEAEARIDAVRDGMDGARLAHLAAHGRVRSDNPLFSSLRLADGPLMAYDLEQLKQAPHTVVLASCDTGRPVVRAGDELMGLTATLLAHGTSQLVASVIPVLDAETAEFMTAFHRRLIAGEPTAQALAGIQADLKREGSPRAAAVAGFVCIGDGLAAPA